MMHKKKLRSLIAGILVAGAIILFYQFNKPPRSYEKAKVEISISANMLHDAFNKDEEKANHIYLNKVVEVSGQPVSVNKNTNGTVTICLEDDLMGVSCTFDSLYVVKNSNTFASAETKQNINIKGRCDGHLTDVRLSKCSFTSN